MEKQKSKLIKPLFVGMNFNYDGKRMRAILEREISDEIHTYRLWRKAGQFDHDYPRANNDTYLLYVEINDYLIPLRMTDFSLVNQCGYNAAIRKMYGNMEERERKFRFVRETEGDDGIVKLIQEENRQISECGADPKLQVEYIRQSLNSHIEMYNNSKSNGGKTFPDFVGAALLNDLEHCKELSKRYKQMRTDERKAHIAAVHEQEKRHMCEVNKAARDVVEKAIQIIRDGGTIKNEEITVYSDDGVQKTYHLINYLMRLFGVDVPLRTQGWINGKLAEVLIENRTCNNLRYYKKKNGQCSQKFFEYMRQLISAIINNDFQAGKIGGLDCEK